MIVVDTSVWVDHLRDRNPVLLGLIGEGRLLHHPFVTAELALGSLPDRDRFCAMLGGFEQLAPISTEQLLTFVVEHELCGTGLGMVDAHLLASATEIGQATLWSTDKRLASQARRLGVAYEPARLEADLLGEAITMDWERTLFLHTGWAESYDGTQAPVGGHEYLKEAFGVEAENFKPVDGWCYGYAPVSPKSRDRKSQHIQKGDRTLGISKLGARPGQDRTDGVMVVWTATRPGHGPVIVGFYKNATVFRNMGPDSDDVRPFIAKTRVEDAILLPPSNRTFAVTHKLVGFPGQAAAWFPGEHQHGPAKEFLAEAAEYINTII